MQENPGQVRRHTLQITGLAQAQQLDDEPVFETVAAASSSKAKKSDHAEQHSYSEVLRNDRMHAVATWQAEVVRHLNLEDDPEWAQDEAILHHLGPTVAEEDRSASGGEREAEDLGELHGYVRCLRSVEDDQNLGGARAHAGQKGRLPY